MIRGKFRRSGRIQTCFFSRPYRKGDQMSYQGSRETGLSPLHPAAKRGSETGPGNLHNLSEIPVKDQMPPFSEATAMCSRLSGVRAGSMVISMWSDVFRIHYVPETAESLCRLHAFIERASIHIQCILKCIARTAAARTGPCYPFQSHDMLVRCSECGSVRHIPIIVPPTPVAVKAIVSEETLPGMPDRNNA